MKPYITILIIVLILTFIIVLIPIFRWIIKQLFADNDDPLQLTVDRAIDFHEEI